MSLANGRHMLAIPGPSVMPDRVLAAMQRPAPNIYAGALPEMVADMVPDLRAVARTKHDVAIYISNGHGLWEAVLNNTVRPGDRVLVVDTGHFARGWAGVAEALGLTVMRVGPGDTGAFAAADLAKVLAEDHAHAIKAVLMTHVDTSTSARNDIAALAGAVRGADHPALVIADCIASLGCDRFEMDAWGVDVAFTASQKGLMTPPGLGFVFFNDRASAARDRLGVVPPYWDWRPRARPERFYQYFGGTAPTHHLFALREALTMLVHEEGLEAAWARHEILARAVWAAMDAWAADGPLMMHVTDPARRSHAVTAAHIGSPDGTALRDWLTENMGVTLGIGLGMAPPGDPAWHGFFRIAHMGHVNAHMVLGTLGAVEAGMMHLGIAHGTGGPAAAARVCATGRRGA